MTGPALANREGILKRTGIRREFDYGIYLPKTQTGRS